ncbi:transglutaminase family protein [Sphingosinithalassobacter sp. LHW66-3]|uniref:transglutaminase family protein n=1 Tax=Sphingosinithalassobacter sp. LHW66-3 TaxID=3424718 RepID=UPI003D6A2E51
MRIAIEHRTRYRFTEPQARIVQLLRLTPCDTLDQTVVAWRIDVDRDARLRKSEDGYGNETTMLYAEGPLEELEVSVTGEVLTLASDGRVREAAEPLPPMFFLRTTQRTLPSAPLKAFARDAAGDTGAPLERLNRLNSVLHKRFRAVQPLRDQGITVAEAFESKQVSARDVAQMFTAAARVLEIPARYVSGYRHAEGSATAPHAWAEAHVEGEGWIAFDPSAGACADERYVRAAVALDASQAAPIAGHRVGAGEERLDVDVQVERLGGDA